MHMCYTRINTTNHLHTLDIRDPQMNILDTQTHACIDSTRGHFRYMWNNIIHKSHTTTTTKSILPVQKEHTHKDTLCSHYTKTTFRHWTHTKHIHFTTCYTQTTLHVCTFTKFSTQGSHFTHITCRDISYILVTIHRQTIHTQITHANFFHAFHTHYTQTAQTPTIQGKTHTC